MGPDETLNRIIRSPTGVRGDLARLDLAGNPDRAKCNHGAQWPLHNVIRQMSSNAGCLG